MHDALNQQEFDERPRTMTVNGAGFLELGERQKRGELWIPRWESVTNGTWRVHITYPDTGTSFAPITDHRPVRGEQKRQQAVQASLELFG